MTAPGAVTLATECPHGWRARARDGVCGACAGLECRDCLADLLAHEVRPDRSPARCEGCERDAEAASVALHKRARALVFDVAGALETGART